MVSQIGSREHYAAPRAFQSFAQLDRLYTDLWSGRAAPFLHRLPPPLRSPAGRYHPALPPGKVYAFNLLSARLAAAGWYQLHRRPGERSVQYEMFDRIGKAFAEHVAHHLSRSNFDPSGAAAFLYSTGALETAQWLRNHQVPVVVDQLDPAQLDEEMMTIEAQRWPGWEHRRGQIPVSYYQRLAEEWRLASRVLVNSQWSAQNLLNQGVDPAKIVVVPLCYEPALQPAAIPVTHATPRDPRLHVLWIGQIILRKGVPYLFEAARQLSAAPIRFTLAGQPGISAEALATAPPNVTVFPHRIPRAQAVELFRDADVFVLPTISDGFALTQLEAMSFGLPVITTPHCGNVVTEGVDGFIVPARSSDALARAILTLEQDRDRLRQMSAAALATPGQHRFSLQGYAEAVEAALAGAA
jgi:glycosyltransferase involved in cell wall biosynthesis